MEHKPQNKNLKQMVLSIYATMIDIFQKDFYFDVESLFQMFYTIKINKTYRAYERS